MQQHESQPLFEMPEDIIYLNAANIGPRLRSVSAAGRDAISRFSRPWEMRAEDWFSGPERLRESFARFVSVDVEQIAFIPSVSYGIATAARNLRVSPGSNIVVVAEQYPSNVYAWRRLAAAAHAAIITAQRGPTLPLSDSVLQCINRKTDVVAIPNCHWIDGEVIDLVAVAEACRKVGAALVVDASQSLGVRPIDWQAVKPDFVVSVGYKWLLGPYGLGFMFVAEEWCKSGTPLEESWLTRRGSEDFTNLTNYIDEYRGGARRFDFGEFPQFISVPMAEAAISQLIEWSMERIGRQLARHVSAIRQCCEGTKFSCLPEWRSAQHMIGIRHPGERVISNLMQTLIQERVFVSRRGAAIRISPHMHNKTEDLEKLCYLIQTSGT